MRARPRRRSCSSRSGGCRWSWSGSKKNLSSSDARELRKLVDHDHPELSVSRECALLGLTRSTLYYQPTPVRESTLQIMARIDAHYLEDPCSGSRRMVGYLARDGIPISRDRVQNLMRRMGLRAIYQKPRTTVPGDPSERFLSRVNQVEGLNQIVVGQLPMPGGSQNGHSCGSGVGHRYHLHPPAERIPLPGGNRGSVLQARSQLEAVEQP